MAAAGGAPADRSDVESVTQNNASAFITTCGESVCQPFNPARPTTSVDSEDENLRPHCNFPDRPTLADARAS